MYACARYGLAFLGHRKRVGCGVAETTGLYPTGERADMNKHHNANRVRWNLGAEAWAAMHDRRGTWRVAHREPRKVFLSQELDLIGDVDRKHVCVLGSGDNLAVFAFAGMGARVTSVDISAEQLSVARGRAGKLGLDIEFVEADVTDLGSLPDACFDVVYTGGHVAVWVSDLRTYYREAIRILRTKGLFLITEYHPFRRIWKDQASPLEVGFSYFDNGPHEYTVSRDVLDKAPGDTKQFEFHWTVSEYLRAVIEQGVKLIRFEEIGDEAEGWEVAPLQGLPQKLLIAGRKN